MSECRSLTDFVGHAVATVVVSRREGGLHMERFQAPLAGRTPRVDQAAPDAVPPG